MILKRMALVPRARGPSRVDEGVVKRLLNILDDSRAQIVSVES